MSKINLNVLHNFISKNPTSKEIDFLLYIAQYQGPDGVCRGIYYKDAMTEIPCCKQSFYAIMRSLEKKGIISVSRESDIDYDITIVGNDAGYQNGYLYARKPVLHTAYFKKLPAGAKMIALDLLILIESSGNTWDIGAEKFEERYMKFLPFRIKSKTLKHYITLLKSILFFKVARLNSKGKKFIIGKKQLRAERPHEKQTDNELWSRHFVFRVLHRNGLAITGNKKINDIAQLIIQYKDLANDICKVVERGIVSSLYKVANKSINSKLIHKYIRLILFNEPLTF